MTGFLRAGEVADILAQISSLLKHTNEQAHTTKVKDGKL